MKKNTLFNILVVIVILALAVLITILFLRNEQLQNDIEKLQNDTNSGEVLINDDYETDTIMMEGLEETIITKKYKSDLGYSIKYDFETFILKRENRCDFYYTVNDNAYFSICVVDQITNMDTTVKVGENTYYVKKEIVNNLINNNYYIKNNNKYYAISEYYQNNIEVEEGLALRMYYTIETIKFDK